MQPAYCAFARAPACRLLNQIAGCVGADATAFCSTLPERCGVVAIPTSVFYDDVETARTLVRFAFCKQEDVIAEAARRLAGLAAAR